MKITEHEMRGLMAGKCLPGDMRLNEDLPAYLVRKFDELQQKLDAMAESMPSLNDEERQKYIDSISTQMRSIAEERDENLQFEYDILRLARAALITHNTADKAG